MPDWYMAPLNPDGRPVDIAEKPELVYGSIEAVVEGSMFNMNENRVTIGIE